VHDDPENPTEDATLTEVVSPKAVKAMGFFEHLEDLRWTLIKCAVVYLVFAVLIGVFLMEFNNALLWPFTHVKKDYPTLVLDLGTTTIMEGFSIVVQICCAGALVPATPFFLYFIGQFVAPALTPKEIRLVLPICAAAFVLFVLGSVFSFFLLVPNTLRVTIELNEFFGFVMRWTAGSYYGLLTWLVLGVGAAFEFPLVILLLVYIGLLKVATLRKYRRHAIVAIFTVAAIVTPTTDPFTMTMLAIPLYLLYEIAILVSLRVERRRPR